MIVGSVCTGIAADALAFHPLGWRHAWFAEIDPFCNAVLSHHYNHITNHGDFTKIGKEPETSTEPIDLLFGGTPCQSFSIAGLRGGLDDDRGNLALEFLRLASRLRPVWVVWENVPGVLSSTSHNAPDPCPPSPPMDVGRDGQEMETEDEYDSEELHSFNCFLAGLAELGYGWAYRVLDAQHFGVPQRRRRVFVIGHLGDWRCAAAVLFERHCLSGYPSPSREAGSGDPGRIAACLNSGGNDGGFRTELGEHLIAHSLCAHNQIYDYETENLIIRTNHTSADSSNISVGVSPTLESDHPLAIIQRSLIRRLTPLECERLMGIPDNYTLVKYRGKPASDSRRYKAIGNSIAVPVLRWIGERIEMLNRFTHNIAP